MALKKLKSGKYRVDCWVDGRRKRRTFENKAAADYFLANLTLFDRDNFGGSQRYNLSHMKFQELAERYKKEHLKHTKAWNNRGYINTLINRFGKYILCRITPQVVKPWFYELFNKPFNGRQLSNASVLMLLKYLKRVFNWGMEMDIIDRNPVTAVSFKKEAKRVNKRNVIITEEEYKDILKALPLYARRIVICAWCSGMRQGEIIRLQWKHVDLINRLIRLPADATKESDYKVAGIEQDLYEALIDIQTERPKAEADEYVFLYNGQPLLNNTIQQIFRRTIREMEIRHIVFHDLRHTYVTRKRREGFERSIIKKQTGHHTDSMFEWYNSVEEFEIQAMAGYTTKETVALRRRLDPIIEYAQREDIPLGTVQEIVGRLWRERQIT